MPNDCYILTTALPIGEYCLKNINLFELGNTINFLNLMGYDFNGAWTKTSGHHAQLRSPSTDPAGSDRVCPPGKSCARGVDYILSQGFPPHKIILGVPVYARFFASARGPSEDFVEAGEMEYNDLPDEWIIGAEVDDTIGAASVVDDEGGRGFVSLDVPQTVAMKAQYIKERMLAGLFFWTVAGDRKDGLSLVASGYNHLLLRDQQDQGQSAAADEGPHYTVASSVPRQES